MRKVGGRAGIVVGVLLAWCACAAALDPSLDVSQYAHTSWKVRDGFTKGPISAIAQTPDGYLWLGTEFGLVRFDGVRAVPWQPPTGVQLPSNDIVSLLAARDGTLWIGMRGAFASWKDGELTAYPEMAGQGVARLLEDREGTIWAGGIAVPPPGKLCAIRSGRAQCYGEDGSMGNGVIGLYEDAQSNLWVGGFKGFWRWKPGPPKFFSMPEEADGIRAFVEDDEGALLIGSHTGIKRLANGRIEAFPLPAAAQGLRVQGMSRDRDGSFWIGTIGRGLVHLHHGRADVFTQADGLSDDWVERFLEDREGNVWAVTSFGLDRFRAYMVPTISTKQGITGYTASVLAAKEGVVWIATVNALYKWEHGQISVFGARAGSRKPDGKLNGLSPNTLFEDSGGKIWVSTTREFGYLENERFVPLRGYPGGFVHSIVEKPAGHLWVQNQQEGIFHVFQGAVVQQIPWARLGHKDFAMPLAADPSRPGIWLGFGNSIAYFQDSEIRESYSAADGLGKGRVTTLRSGSRGSLWVATQGGLSRLKDGRVATLTSKNGLPCDSVNWTMEDNEHSVWVYMSCGLVRIARSDLDDWVTNPTRAVRMTVFDTSDGVLSRAMGGGFGPQVTKSPDGKIWFRPGDGVSVIDPNHLAFNKLPPPVHIEQVTADDKTYDATNGLRLPPRVRYLAIDYTALSLVAPEKVRFRYKLEGEDKNWREVVNKREVQYTNLGPKHYRFRVLACNNSGVWNEQGDTLEFVIPPEWYQTNWFYALCAATFLLMLWGLYRLRVLQLQREFNATLEGRVAERTRVARDLHDTLLQSFHGLMLRFGVVDRLLPSRVEEAQTELRRAMALATDAITEGRDAVQALRSSTIVTNDLVIAIKTIGEELAANQTNPGSPSFGMRVEGTSRDLRPLLRDEVYRIAAEALRNAFRHANASRIEAEVRYGDKQFRIRIRDDGKGIDPTVLSGDGPRGHYGLPGMRERAQLVGGKLAVWSELEGGTEIELTIPAANAYEAGQRSSWWTQRFSGKESEVAETKIES